MLSSPLLVDWLHTTLYKSALFLSYITLALQGKGLLLCHAQRSEHWPCDCAGKDIIGLAQTGSGKTGAFALPILQVR